MARLQRREGAMTHHDDGKPCSLTRFLIEEQRGGRIGPDLRLLVEVVARACKRISIAVGKGALRSEEHTSELQSLMRISYAVFCLKTKTQSHIIYNIHLT